MPNRKQYSVQTDFFEGRVGITTPYYESLPEAERDEAYIEVQFGFRTLANGALALAAYLPDLLDKSEGHVNRWKGFLVRDLLWSDYEQDERFKNWIRRNLEGDWDVDNGPAHYLPEEIKLINGLTSEAVGAPLFALEHEPHISFPTAQNSHRYEDAHVDLYRIIHDGIDRGCIEKLGERVKRPLNVKSSQTLSGLKTLFPSLDLDSAFSAPLEKVSQQRRRAAHKQRLPRCTASGIRSFYNRPS